MVFESLVVDLLNKFLGDYVENLDSSQLNLGIWGGNKLVAEIFLGMTGRILLRRRYSDRSGRETHSVGEYF